MGKTKKIEELELALVAERARVAGLYSEIDRLHGIRRERGWAIEILRTERNRISAARDQLAYRLAEVREAVGASVTAVPDVSLKGLAAEFKLGAPMYRFEGNRTIRVGQVRRNRDYEKTLIRILAPPRPTSYGLDDTWLVEYLTTGRTVRRATRFIRAFYPEERFLVPARGLGGVLSPNQARPFAGLGSY